MVLPLNHFVFVYALDTVFCLIISTSLAWSGRWLKWMSTTGGTVLALDAHHLPPSHYTWVGKLVLKDM